MMFIYFDGSSGKRVRASGIAKTGSANCANCANSLEVTLLVIFDCDGVLVDSEPIANASFSRALKAQGLDWSAEETIRRLMGLSLKSALEICETEIGRKLPDDFLEKMQAVTYQSFRDAPLMPVAGVKEAVETCRLAGIRAVMITGDHKLTATAIAREIGLWDEGDEAITGAELGYA